MVASSVYYLHEDALGSVRLVATTSVTITFSSNYVPYGSNYAMVGKEVFMYTGKMYDSSTGLYYLMARYYDPTIGRFITEDSYAGDDSDPMTLNRYIYARDNPERYTDPNGHMFVVENDQGQEFGGDYLYTPAVVKTVTVADTERKRNEYVTDTPAMTTYQNTAFEGSNPYGGGQDNALFDYQKNAFGLHNPCGTPAVGTTTGRLSDSFWGAVGAIGIGLATGIATFWGGAEIAARASFEIGGLRSLGIAAGLSDVVDPIAAGAIPLFATGWTIGYAIRTMQSGQTPTWPGAWNAFWQGIGVAVQLQPPDGV